MGQSMIDRKQLIERYLALQDEARGLGLVGTSHATADLSDDELLRRGVILKKRVESRRAVLMHAGGDLAKLKG